MQGKLIIFSAPSGSGKTTLINHLLANRTDLAFSISCTTREVRGTEEDGKDYYFLDQSTFDNKVKEAAFVEWEEVYKGTSYGTLKKEIQRIWDEGKHVLFDIDVVGGLNLKKIYKNQALAVFIKAPNLAILKSRLESRGTDSAEKVTTRLSKAEEEMTYASKFDITLINENLATCQKEVLRIVDGFITN